MLEAVIWIEDGLLRTSRLFSGNRSNDNTSWAMQAILTMSALDKGVDHFPQVGHPPDCRVLQKGVELRASPRFSGVRPLVGVIPGFHSSKQM